MLIITMPLDGFTGMGIPSFAITLSMFRKFLYLASVAAPPFVCEIQNIFYAEAISDFGGTAVSTLVYLLVIRKVLERCNPEQAAGTN